MKKKIHLNKQEVNSYNNDGYTLITNFFNIDEINKLKKWSEAIYNWPPSTTKYLNYYEMVNGRKILSRTEAFLPYHEEFDTFINDSSIFNIAEQLIGEPVFLFKEKINFKYPGTGKYPPHQDIHAAKRSRLAFQHYHCNCLIFVDDSTEENGCLYVSPSYKGQFLDINSDGSIKEEIVNNIEFSALEAKAGDIGFFDMYTPHYSNLNTSSNSRRTVYLTFNGQSKGDLRREHFDDRAKNLGKTLEISPDLFVDHSSEI